MCSLVVAQMRNTTLANLQTESRTILTVLDRVTQAQFSYGARAFRWYTTNVHNYADDLSSVGADVIQERDFHLPQA